MVVKFKFSFRFIIFDEEVDFDEGFFGLGRKFFLGGFVEVAFFRDRE